MFSTQIIANTILFLAFNEKIQVTPMKLQKLIYLAYKQYLKDTGDQLFSEKIQAWRYGPVIPSIYDNFKSFSSRPINRFMRNTDESINIINMDSRSAAQQSIKKIWNKYRKFNGVELSQFTHRTGTAWEKAWKINNQFLEDDDIKNEEEF